jgi:hypothetical protein
MREQTLRQRRLFIREQIPNSSYPGPTLEPVGNIKWWRDSMNGAAL